MAVDPKFIRLKILRLLEVYPVLSPAMLHIGIGTSVPSALRRPILDKLITENWVYEKRIYVERGRADGKSKQYVLISLTKDGRAGLNKPRS